ncbi:EpsG family protein [Culturomica sp.]|uniref:EpsG family protein n=1 Tax=Culturomica sp. TaxID=1926652 RepID=UPI000E881D22|nr:EpsG family protein [Culturomica sp.]HBO25475.1 hypothetical protein [Culturomica sp.]
MIPYILILLLLCLGLFYELYLPSARQDMISFQHRAVYFFLVSAVALMTGFRDMIGGYDVYIYAWFFDEIPAIDSLFPWSAGDPSVYFRFEPGYLLLNSVIKFFCADAYFYFFTVALLTYFLIGKAFRRYPFFVFAFFLFFAKFFIVGFVYTRQFIAMGIVWWSLRFLEENRKNVFLVFLLLATTIHYSAFVVFPMYFLANRRFSGKFLGIVFVVALVLGVSPFIKWVMASVNHFLMLDKLDGYAEAAQDSFHIPYFIETSLMVAGVLYYRKRIYADKKYIVLLNMLVLYSVFSYLTLRDAGVIRFIWYYFIGYAVLVPVMLFRFVRYKELILLFVLIYFSFVYFRNVIVRDDGNFIPYKAVFMDTHREDKFR